METYNYKCAYSPLSFLKTILAPSSIEHSFGVKVKPYTYFM